MLAGFANFASIGIQIGGIGSLAPKQEGIAGKIWYESPAGRNTCISSFGNNNRNDTRIA